MAGGNKAGREERRYRRRRRGDGGCWALRGILLASAAVLLAVSGWQLSEGYREQKKNEDLAKLASAANLQREFEAAVRGIAGGSLQSMLQNEELAGIRDWEDWERPYEPPVDFEALRAVNPDVVGWIRIPDTVIDYPIVYSGDNEKYLDTGFDGRSSSSGAIFLDCDSQTDMMGRHTLFYGHHMKNGSMFAELVNYKNEDYFKAHRDIYIYTPEREIHLLAAAALYTDAGGDKRRTAFSGQKDFDAYVDEMTDGCSFRELPDGETERLYSLVTCSYEFGNARTILYAVDAAEYETGGAAKD